MGDAPLISVIMGVYCQKISSDLLSRSISSILEQSWNNFELIICDDGSCEEAKALIDKFADQDARVRLVRGQEKILLSEKLNVCLAAARGAWIARMDDDDYSYPQRFQKQMDFLQNHPEIDFIGCNVRYQTEAGSIFSNFPENPTPKDFLFSMPYIHPTLIFRRECLDAVDGYSEASVCKLCEDFDLLLRLYQKGFHGANLKECLFDYSLIGTERRRRTFAHRLNEVKMRYKRFGDLHLLPGAFPFVIKPLLVGILPTGILNVVRRFRLRHKK